MGSPPTLDPTYDTSNERPELLYHRVLQFYRACSTSVPTLPVSMRNFERPKFSLSLVQFPPGYGLPWNLHLRCNLSGIWQKNASGLLVAIFCQIYTTQYKIHKFLRGLEHCWLPVAKNCHWQASGKLLAFHWRKLPELVKIQCKFCYHTPISATICFSPITHHKADDDSNDGAGLGLGIAVLWGGGRATWSFSSWVC